MKTVGVFRKIDELGRVVIPKEIRDNLRIKVGEPLAISVNGSDIILNKYSPLSKVQDISRAFVSALEELVGMNVIITDRNKVLAAPLGRFQKLIDQPIADKLVNFISKRDFTIIKGSSDLNITKTKLESGHHLILPLAHRGDYLGLIILLSKDEITNQEEEKLNFVANWISKYFD